MPRESKGELRKRLRREWRFGAFVARREELKQQGKSARDAWRIAVAEFPPLAGASVPVQRPAPLVGDFEAQGQWRHDDDPECIDDSAGEPASPGPGLPIAPPQRPTSL